MTLDTDLNELWAKLDKELGAAHPLVYHLLDVGNVVRALLTCPAGKPVARQLAEGMSLGLDETVAWASFVAALHDLGKAEWHFQKESDATRGWMCENKLKSSDGGCKIRHEMVSAYAVFAILRDGLYGIPAVKKDTARRIACVLGGHHGTFRNWREITKHLEAWERNTRWDEVRREIAENVAGHFLKDVVRGPKFAQDDQNNNVTPLLLAGLIVFADWLASDVSKFPYAPDLTLDGYLPASRARAADALAALGWTRWQPAKILKEFVDLFENVHEPPNSLQIRVARLARDQVPRLVIIEAPTGIGKTEAALTLYHHWAIAHAQRGLYFAMPTMATSNQMHARTKAFLYRHDPDTPSQLQLLHSQAVLNDAFSGITATNVAQDDAGTDGDSAANAWFRQRKRGLLAPAAVGTVDQALLSVLRTRHGFLRLLGLAGKTIIFDEVHAYDVHMQTLFAHLLRWLRALDCTVVILSATLPRDATAKLLEAYDGKLASADLAAYPRLSWVDDRGDAHTETLEAPGSRSIALRWVENAPENILHDLTQATAEGGCVAWLCNTVNDAQARYKLLKPVLEEAGFEVDLFHARYPQFQRQAREDRVLAKFGRDADGARPHKAIVFATQVIEQSLDLDFDLMVSDLAPIDLLLQRLGRLHRHDRARPAGLTHPTVWILSPLCDDKGMVSACLPYETYYVTRTRLALGERTELVLPRDTEALIELVYGEGSVTDDANLAAQFEVARKELQDKFKYQVRDASATLVPKPLDNYDALDGESELSDDDDPTTHSSLQAHTRHQTAPSIQIICLHDLNGKLYADANGGQEFSPDQPLPRAEAFALRRNVVTLTDWANKKEVPVHKDPASALPKPWQKASGLRHHRLARFVNREVVLGNKRLTWDDERGIVISSHPA